MVVGGRGGLELHDVDFADGRVFAAGETDGAETAGVAQARLELRGDKRGEQQSGQQNESQDVHLVVPVAARFLCRELDAESQRDPVDEVEIGDDQRQVEDVVIR